jgi:hypothetical protein
MIELVTALLLVEDERQISSSHRQFLLGSATHRALALSMIRRTRYWVYDPADRTFSPSKFSGYVAMNFSIYGSARTRHPGGVKFDGGVTRNAIARVLGPYEPDDELASELEAWVKSQFGAGALDGIERRKWSFVRLPPTGAHGLAALAGGWEGSEELVESLSEVRRTPGRAAPELE